MAVSLFHRHSHIGMAKNNHFTWVFLGDLKKICRCFFIWDFLSFIEFKWFTLVLNIIIIPLKNPLVCWVDESLS